MTNIQWLCETNREKYNTFIDALNNIVPFDTYCDNVKEDECSNARSCVNCRLNYLMQERREE